MKNASCIKYDHISIIKQIGEFIKLSKKALHKDEVMSLLELKYNPSDNFKLECHILHGAITIDQISVSELRTFIQKYRINDILFGMNQMIDNDNSSMVHPMIEYELIYLFLDDNAILHKCFLYDGYHVSDMHCGVLLAWLYIVRMLYHETRFIISQKIQELKIINDVSVNIIMDYIHHDTYLKFTNKSNDDKFFQLAMIYMTDFVFHLSVDKENWKQFVIDNIWNKLSLEQIAIIRNNRLMESEAYEIWVTLEYETNKRYKERTLQIFDIHSNPRKSMKDRPNAVNS